MNKKNLEALKIKALNRTVLNKDLRPEISI